VRHTAAIEPSGGSASGSSLERLVDDDAADGIPVRKGASR
jgi:hypothetical protein